MPLLIESLDDAVITDETPAFAGGTVSNARPANLRPDQFWFGENVDLSIIGRLTTRRGTVTVGDNFDYPVLGLGHLSIPTENTLVAVVDDDNDGNATLKIWDGAAWDDPTGLIHFFDPLLPVQMVQGGNLLWIVQAGELLTYYDGTDSVFAPHVGNDEAPDEPSLVEWHTNRLVLAGMPTLPDTVSFSKFLLNATDIAGTTGWDHVNWDINVGYGDGDPITGLRSWTNSNLVVFKEHSTWVVNCDPTLLLGDATLNSSAFQIARVHGQIGCQAPNTAVQAGADVFFLSDSGVRSVARTLASESQNQLGPALSDPIADIIARINPAAIQYACATYWRNRYILSVALDSDTYPQHTLILNTLTGTWSGYWTGISPTAYVRRIHGSTPKLCIGQSDGKVVDFRDYTPESSEVDADYEDDDAAEYPTVIETRAFTCGDQDAHKTGLFTRMEFKLSQGEATVSVVAGKNETPQELATFSTDGGALTLPFTLPATLPSGGYLPKSFGLMHLGQWRELRVRIESAAHKIALNKVSVGAFMDTFKIEE